MILVNDREHPYVEGETVEDTLKRTEAFFPFMVVRLNGTWLRKDDWTSTPVEDGSSIRTVEMIAGG